MKSRRSLIVLSSMAVALFLVHCSGGDDDQNENRAILSLAGPATVNVFPGETVDLAWLLVRQSSGPQPGHTVAFSILGVGGHGATLSDQFGTTDGGGLAKVTFQAGTEPFNLPIQVEGHVSDIPSSEPQPAHVAFTVNVVDPIRVLRAVGDETVAGATEGSVRLAVRASSNGARPLPNEAISWQIMQGGEGSMDQAGTNTDMSGVAVGTLNCGAQAGSVVVQASMEGTAPVTFTVNLSQWEEPPPECTTNEQCGDGRRCRFGTCVASTAGAPCKENEECEDGQTCVAGFCTGCNDTECPCASSDDCPEGFVCAEDGTCVCPADNPDCDGDLCEGGAVDHPDLTGNWDVDTTLHLREALPSWLDDLLGTLGPPFRFLSDGILGGFDFDIPVIGDALEDAADSIVGQYIPRWLGEMLRAIADINDIMSTFNVDQELRLWGSGNEDEYNGELEWGEVSLTWSGEAMRGRLEDITGLHVDPDSVECAAICGTFYIHRHDVSVAFGTIVRWVLDVIVTAVTGGEYTSLEELLESLVEFCDPIAEAVDDLAYELSEWLDINLPDVYDLVYRMCEAGIEAGARAAVDWLEGIMVSSDAITMAGTATIDGPNNLDDGDWDCTLLGRDFSGEFTGRHR